MIKYKASERLGLLNEEDFTSNPTSRDWSVTGTATYDANGAKVSAYNINTATTFTIITKPIYKYFSYTFRITSSSLDSIAYYDIKLYINDVLVNSTDVSSRLEYGNNSARGSASVIMNNPNEWVVTYSHGYVNNYNATGYVTSGVNVVDVGSSIGNKISIVVEVIAESAYTVNAYLTNLRWS